LTCFGQKRATSEWRNTFLSFRLRPVNLDGWVEQVEAMLGSSRNWRERNVRASVVLEALRQPKLVWVHYSRRTGNSRSASSSLRSSLVGPSGPFLLSSADDTDLECGIDGMEQLGDEFSSRGIIKAVDWLDAAGWLYHRKTKRMRLAHGERVPPTSSFMATDYKIEINNQK
jgi:hypothetical protein